MKEQVTIPSIKLNLVKFVLVILVIVIGIISILQWKSNYKINQDNKILNKKNELLNKHSDSILSINKKYNIQIKEDSILIIKNQFKVDSLLKRDSIHIKQLKTIKWRYAKLKADYNSATDDDKNELFTELINK